MAKPGRKPKIKEEIAPEVAGDLTIKNLASLRDKWEVNKLDPRVYIALKVKLLELKKSDKIHELEEKMLWDLLQRERAQAIEGVKLGYVNFTDSDEYLLNAWEASNCDKECVVKVSDAPAVHGLIKDAKMRFYYDGEANRYHVYPIRIVPPDHQLDITTAKRIAAGITVDPADFPPAKVLVRHINLNAKEFERWFNVVEGDVLESASHEGLLEL